MRRHALACFAILGLTAPLAREASAQTTFTACRVPTVGVIYMLNDAADPCLDGAHVKFSWTEGGAPADGSITTAKIANGAVTLGKLATMPVLVTSAVGTGINLSTTSTTFQSGGSVSITVPSAGRVMVTVTGTCEVLGDNTLVEIGIGTAAGSGVTASFYCGTLGGSASYDRFTPYSQSQVFNVTAGTHTYYLNARMWATAAYSAALFGHRLMAVFIPG